MNGMHQLKAIFYFFILTAVISCKTEPQVAEKMTFEDRLSEAVFTGSKFIDDRRYQVFLPQSYVANTEKKYPVLYMMDGQNLFVDSLSYSKFAWNIHRVSDSLFAEKKIPEIIVVGIDNAMVKRFSEYMPQKPVDAMPKVYKDSLETLVGHPIYSDAFLAFLTQEFKPHIDANFRSLSDVKHTYIGGSSMGGLISMYAQCEYPEIFGGAMCFSTHWPIAVDDTSPELGDGLVAYFEAHLPTGKKWYFDYGTEGLDQYYEKYQLKADSVLQAKGYEANKNYLSLKFEGHGHQEKYWYQRLHTPLTFVLGE